MTTTLRNAVSEMRPPRYTTQDVAEKIGRSRDTVVRWRKTGLFVPSECADFGGVTVWLYTAQDIRDLRKLAASQHPGRKVNDSTQWRYRARAKASSFEVSGQKARRKTRFIKKQGRRAS